MTALTSEQVVELEQMIDNASLWDVLNALEQVAYEKSEHLRSNWQDPVTAKLWERAARAISRAQPLAFEVSRWEGEARTMGEARSGP
jgi:hypothetical protein